MLAAAALVLTACQPGGPVARGAAGSVETTSTVEATRAAGAPAAGSDPADGAQAQASPVAEAPVAAAASAEAGAGDAADKPPADEGPAAPTPARTEGGPSAPSGVGLPAGIVLRPSSGLVASTPGQIVEGLDIRGTVEVTAPGVTIRNSRLTGSGEHYGVLVAPGGSVEIDHVVIRGDYRSAGFRGAGLTIRNSELVGLSNDGGKLENDNVVADNLFHAFAPSPGAHSDALQMETPAGNVRVTGNTILMPGRGSPALENVTGALFIVPELASSYGPRAPGPVIVSGNTLGGGNHTTHFDSADFPLTELQVTGNRFVDDSAFGPVYASGYLPAAWSGNAFEDGTPIGPPA